MVQGGMVYANAVTTVSPTYAQEVLNGGAAGWLRETMSRTEVGTTACGEGKQQLCGSQQICKPKLSQWQ